MPIFVRAKDTISGAEVTVAAEYAQAQSLDVLDKDAVDEYGRPLPSKHLTGLAGDPIDPAIRGRRRGASSTEEN